jgi:hypothetical protein
MVYTYSGCITLGPPLREDNHVYMCIVPNTGLVLRPHWVRGVPEEKHNKSDTLQRN